MALRVSDAVLESVCVGEALGVALGVTSCVRVKEAVADGVGVRVGVAPCVPVWLAVCVGVGESVGTYDVVCVDVAAADAVPLAEVVGVRVPEDVCVPDGKSACDELIVWELVDCWDTVWL